MQLTGELNEVVNPSDLENEWLSLQQVTPHSFFQSWLWLFPWANLVSQKTKLYVFKARQNDNIVALCFITLCKIRRRKGLLSCNQVQINEFRDLDCDMTAQYNGILCSEAHLNPVWKTFLQTLQSNLSVMDEILISSLPENQYLAVRDACENQYCWVQDENHSIWKVPLAEENTNVDSLLLSFKRKSRQQLRQSLRAINEKWGEIKIERALNIEQALQYFDEMSVIHTERWNRVGEQGAFARKNWSEFHKNVIVNGFDQNKILLFKIFTEHGHLLGFLYGYIEGKEAIMQQTGFVNSPENAIRPGYVSHLYCMMACREMGLECYDFLPDPEPTYKKFFCAPMGQVIRGRVQKKKLKFYLENWLKSHFSHKP